MTLGLKFFCLIHSAFCNYLTGLTRPVSDITLNTVSGRQHNHRQYPAIAVQHFATMAYPAIAVHHFATKKVKDFSQTRVNINITLVEDIINLEEVDEEMKTVIEALKDNFNKTLTIRTSPGSLDHITVVTADGKLTVNQISQISMKSPQLILVNMASFPECTAAAINAVRESGMNLNPEVEGPLIRVPIPIVTREHREMLVKLAKQNTNKAKDSLQRVPTNTMNKLKKSKDKTSEDTIRLIEKQISQMADDTVAKLDRQLAVKTKKLLGSKTISAQPHSSLFLMDLIGDKLAPPAPISTHMEVCHCGVSSGKALPSSGTLRFAHSLPPSTCSFYSESSGMVTLREHLLLEKGLYGAFALTMMLPIDGDHWQALHYLLLISQEPPFLNSKSGSVSNFKLCSD
uniref:Ribosome-recycling factor, mitochondrial n=1 Tax=Sciurus vulgaris TaxID=55149 RepID=A0A8D2CLX9_SCIVU